MSLGTTILCKHAESSTEFQLSDALQSVFAFDKSFNAHAFLASVFCQF